MTNPDLPFFFDMWAQCAKENDQEVRENYQNILIQKNLLPALFDHEPHRAASFDTVWLELLTRYLNLREMKKTDVPICDAYFPSLIKNNMYGFRNIAAAQSQNEFFKQCLKKAKSQLGESMSEAQMLKIISETHTGQQLDIILKCVDLNPALSTPKTQKALLRSYYICRFDASGKSARVFEKFNITPADFVANCLKKDQLDQNFRRLTPYWVKTLFTRTTTEAPQADMSPNSPVVDDAPFYGDRIIKQYFFKSNDYYTRSLSESDFFLRQFYHLIESQKSSINSLTTIMTHVRDYVTKTTALKNLNALDSTTPSSFLWMINMLRAHSASIDKICGTTNGASKLEKTLITLEEKNLEKEIKKPAPTPVALRVRNKI